MWEAIYIPDFRTMIIFREGGKSIREGYKKDFNFKTQKSSGSTLICAANPLSDFCMLEVLVGLG